jgi:hypothetical protein
VKSYFISSVEKQVVAGYNYRISLQKNNAATIQYANFEVFINLNGIATVKKIIWIDITNYSVPQIIQAYNSSLQLHS